jgi:hypothetical protein
LHLKGIIKLDEVLDVPNPFIFPKLARKINRVIDEIRFSDNLSLMARTFIFTIIDTTIDLDEIIKRIERYTPETEKKELTKTPPSINEEDGKSIKSFADVWKKFLSFIAKEKTVVYNILLSSDIKLEDNVIKIFVGKEFDFDLIENNKKYIEDVIEKITKTEYKILPQLKKNLKSYTSFPPDTNEQSFVLKNTGDKDEVSFVELEKIKKVFDGDILKITPKDDETDRKIN